MARNTAITNPNQNHAFNRIPSAEIPRSVFSRSHNVKTTMDAGFLYPFFADECVPGDTIKLSATLFGRMATPIYPIMDNLYLDVFYFAVPERLLWVNFKKMMGEQDNPGDSISYTMPQVVSPAGGFARLGLSDFLGIPPQHSAGGTNATMSVRASWHRAYNLIWNTWFRDENLQNSVTVPTGDGPDTEATYPLLRRGKKKDYFTSTLPWSQKGTAVSLPLGSSAPLVGNVAATTSTPLFQAWNGTALVGSAGALRNLTSASPTTVEHVGGGTAANQELRFSGTTGLTLTGSGAYADLAAATAATINSIRTAFQIQRLYERDARGGTRYIEQVLAHFGVRSEDARQQRPEFLGGGTLNININPVPNTVGEVSPTDVSAQGRLAAFGTVVGGIPTVVKSFTEHSVILGLVMVRADINYQQGVNRMFHRLTKTDFYWPALAHLGEQAVLSKEIFTDGNAADNDVWGYQERWAEMRYKPNLITGELRSSDPLPLDSWHLAQNFSSRPLLNSTFIVEDPPMTRVIAVTNQPHFIMDGAIQYTHIRPMPTYSVPGLIDHF